MGNFPNIAQEREERNRVVTEARNWLKTPYHHGAHLKGVGVDCAQLIIEVFVAAQLAERFDPGTYTHDWHMHRNEEKYLAYVEQYMRRTDRSEESLRDRMRDDAEFRPLPGDLIVWRIGRTFSHSAIVTSWPNVIHAVAQDRIVVEKSLIGDPLSFRPMRVYSFWRNQ